MSSSRKAVALPLLERKKRFTEQAKKQQEIDAKIERQLQDQRQALDSANATSGINQQTERSTISTCRDKSGMDRFFELELVDYINVYVLILVHHGVVIPVHVIQSNRFVQI